MPRRQLQALAKKHGIRANQKTVIIIEALCELFAAEQKRLNQEIEAATLAASGVEPSTANVSMVTEGSFVDVPRSPSDAVNASACSPSSQDDDAASVGDICMSVANAEAAMAVEAEEHMDKAEAPTATNDAPAPAAAPTPVPSAVAATPVVAAPAATEASAKPAEVRGRAMLCMWRDCCMTRVYPPPPSPGQDHASQGGQNAQHAQEGARQRKRQTVSEACPAGQGLEQGSLQALRTAGA